MNVIDLFSTPFLYIRVLWAISLILILWMSRQRLFHTLKQEWDINYQFFRPFRKNIVHTLAKLYVMLEDTNSIKLAEYVRQELCHNSAVTFNKPTAYFIRYREQRSVMREYFKDDNLLNFIANPNLWCLENGGIRYTLFGLKKDNTITPYFLSRLTEIIIIFQQQLYSHYPKIITK
ncbi:MAG: hypothetical protein ACW98K_01060 [Candidatus Kariarchaeaceae archaeon]